MTFEDLYEEYKLNVKWYVRKHIWNKDIQDDVEQATWLEIHKHWAEYDNTRPFMPWVVGHFLNAKKPIIRHEVNEKMVRRDLYNRGPLIPKDDMETIRPDWLQDYPELCTVFTEHHVHNKSLKHIAQKTGIDYNKVRKLNVRIKQLLKEHYDRTNKRPRSGEGG
jgi:DNA-directed RNA polymerase specialized sigma24 family protein